MTGFDMATVLRKSRKRKQTNAALIERMEKSAPTLAKLRRLARKYPAPQAWYDQADHTARPKRK